MKQGMHYSFWVGCMSGTPETADRPQNYVNIELTKSQAWKVVQQLMSQLMEDETHKPDRHPDDAFLNRNTTGNVRLELAGLCQLGGAGFRTKVLGDPPNFST